MRPPVVDELGERRLVRRLAQLADAVEPLPNDELEAIVRAATSESSARPPSRRLRARSWHELPGVAVAAAAVLAIAVGIGQSERRTADPGAGGVTRQQQFAFPEGSALELLLSRAEAKRPA